MFLLILFVSQAYILVGRGSAQTSDFFSNTRRLGQVSTGSAGSCPLCPGFNPTLSDGLLKHVDIGQCPEANLSPCKPPFFSRLGPGAVTDNMFGHVSSATREPGVDGLLGTADDTFSRCGLLQATQSTLSETLSGLNCGNLRFDPVTQGMTLPSGNNSMIQLGGDTAMTSDFFTSDDAHFGISLQNNFQWKNPAANPCGGTTNPPTPPSPGCTDAGFNLIQTNPLLPGQGGTLSSPGAGEQMVDFRVSWSTNNTSATDFVAPTITWSQSLIEPAAEFFNPSPGTPDSTLPCQTTSGVTPFLIHCGSFTYNQDSTFPQVQYPVGASQNSPVQGTIP